MTPASAAPDPAAIMILRMLHAYQERLRGLPAALDASTWAAHAHGLPVHASKDWRQACMVLGVRQVGLPTLLAHTHRLAVLDAESLRLVLAARVFYGRRGALARCIDGAYLSGLAMLLGTPALTALTVREPWVHEVGDALPSLELTQLAEAGLHALIAEGGVTDASLAQLMRLTIGMQAPVPACMDAPVPDALTEPFMAALPVLFPELSWLFG